MISLAQIISLKYLDIFLDILIILIITFIVSHIITYLANRFWKKFNMDLTLLYLFQELIKYIIAVYAIAWILKILGVDLKGIILSLGIIGIIVGFAAKDIFSNFMSGLILVADKGVKVGEVISTKDIKGVVKRVDFRKITLKTVDGFKITLPNSVLSTNSYTNYPKLELNKITLNALLPPEIDLKIFNEMFIKKFNEKSWVLSEKTPIIDNVELNEFGSQVKILVWIDDYSKISGYKLELANEVRKIIKEYDKNTA
jgi:small conductance mechanosensitive channel